jgi:hypothetical protein
MNDEAQSPLERIAQALERLAPPRPTPPDFSVTIRPAASICRRPISR